MDIPTLADSIDQLRAVRGLDEFDPDTPLMTSDVDSLDLIEWLYAMQERYPEIPVDESVFEDIDETVTFRAIHDQIVHV